MQLVMQVLNSLLDNCSALGLWIRLCMSADTDVNAATWRWWDTVRSLCNYHSSLGVLIEIQRPHDMTPELMERRWLGEPIRGAFVCTTSFLRNKRQFPVLPRPLQTVVLQVFKLGQQVRMHASPHFCDAVHCNLCRRHIISRNYYTQLATRA